MKSWWNRITGAAGSAEKGSRGSGNKSRVFISYAREDLEQAKALSKLLEDRKLDVWWDRSLVSGDEFDNVILEKIDESAAVVVIWTRHSIKSSWVKSEARRAASQGKLVPVRAADVAITDLPPPFDGLHAELLSNEIKVISDVHARINGGPADLSRLSYAIVMTLHDLLVERKFGDDDDRNHKFAFVLLDKAASWGVEEALMPLAMMYERGIGTERNAEKSLQLYKQAVQAEDPAAYRELARVYKEGNIVDKDALKAFFYFSKAAEKGDREAMASLGKMYEDGEGVSQDYGKAFSHYRKAADMDSLNGMYGMAILHLEGKGVDKDLARGVRLLRQAADRDHAESIKSLGVVYFNGQGVTQDKQRALHYYEKASSLGNMMARRNLALMYLYGDGVANDQKKGSELLFEAAKGGNSAAICDIGISMILDRRYAEAVELFQMSEQKGYARALYWLGYCYEHGYGVSASRDRAKEYYAQASRKGYRGGQEAFARMDSAILSAVHELKNFFRWS
jgi:TPR repeat protein